MYTFQEIYSSLDEIDNIRGRNSKNELRRKTAVYKYQQRELNIAF